MKKILFLLILFLLPFVSAVDYSWDFFGNNAAIWEAQEGSAIVTNVTNNQLYFTSLGSGTYGHFFTRTNVSFPINDSWNVTVQWRRQQNAAGTIGCPLTVTTGTGILSNTTGGATICYNVAAATITDTGAGYRTDDSARLFFRTFNSGVQIQCEMDPGGKFGTGHQSYLRIRNLGNRTVIGEMSSTPTFSSINYTCILSFASNASNFNISYLNIGEFAGSGAAVHMHQIMNVSWGYNFTAVSTIAISNTNVTSAYINGTGAPSFNRDCSPTVSLTLSLAGSCAISKYNLNYSQMLANNSNQLCGTINATSITCTHQDSECLTETGLTSSNPLYIACEQQGSTSFANTSVNISLDFKFNGTIQYKTSAVKINQSRVSLIPQFRIPSTFPVAPYLLDMFTGWNTTSNGTGYFELYSPICGNYTVSGHKTFWNGTHFDGLRNESGDTEYHITAPCP